MPQPFFGGAPHPALIIRIQWVTEKLPANGQRLTGETSATKALFRERQLMRIAHMQIERKSNRNKEVFLLKHSFPAQPNPTPHRYKLNFNPLFPSATQISRYLQSPHFWWVVDIHKTRLFVSFLEVFVLFWFL